VDTGPGPTALEIAELVIQLFGIGEPPAEIDHVPPVRQMRIAGGSWSAPVCKRIDVLVGGPTHGSGLWVPFMVYPHPLPQTMGIHQKRVRLPAGGFGYCSGLANISLATSETALYRVFAHEPFVPKDGIPGVRDEFQIAPYRSKGEFAYINPIPGSVEIDPNEIEVRCQSPRDSVHLR
jgi:hypothetical protein